jgi:hypothetical protein
MLAASGVGLVSEGLAASTGFPALLVAGGVAGVVLVLVTDTLLDRLDLPEASRAPANSEASEAPPDGRPYRRRSRRATCGHWCSCWGC